MKSAYKYIQETFQKEYKGKDPELKKLYKDKLISWRKEKVQTRAKRPTNPARARTLGYKAKQGYTIVRVKVRKGARTKTRPNKKRRPKRMGTNKITAAKSLQRMGEERVARKHRNMEVLNSYWVGEDGQHKWFEIILVNTLNKSVMKDLTWKKRQKGRSFRGLTSAGRKGRGLKK